MTSAISWMAEQPDRRSAQHQKGGIDLVLEKDQQHPDRNRRRLDSVDRLSGEGEAAGEQKPDRHRREAVLDRRSLRRAPVQN